MFSSHQAPDNRNKLLYNDASTSHYDANSSSSSTTMSGYESDSEGPSQLSSTTLVEASQKTSDLGSSNANEMHKEWRFLLLDTRPNDDLASGFPAILRYFIVAIAQHYTFDPFHFSHFLRRPILLFHILGANPHQSQWEQCFYSLLTYLAPITSCIGNIIYCSFTNGFSPVNSLDQTLFQRMRHDVDVGIMQMVANNAATFSKEISKALLCFSTMTYEDFHEYRPSETPEFHSVGVKTVQSILDEWNLPGLKGHGVKLRTFPERKAAGYVFWDQRRHVIIVVFKGTSMLNFHEWVVDLSMKLRSGDPFTYGKVHSGFYDKLFSVKFSPGGSLYVSTIRHIRYACWNLKKHSRHAPKPKLYLTGHSLGGALAVLFHARLSRYKKDLECATLMATYTFGSPRIGDSTFSTSFETFQYPPCYRIYNHADMVVKCPFGWDTPILSDPQVSKYPNVQHEYGYCHTGLPTMIPPYYLSKLFYHLEPVKSTHETMCILLNTICFLLNIVYVYGAIMWKWSQTSWRLMVLLLISSPLMLIFFIPILFIAIPMYCHTPAAYLYFMNYWSRKSPT